MKPTREKTINQHSLKSQNLEIISWMHAHEKMVTISEQHKSTRTVSQTFGLQAICA